MVYKVKYNHVPMEYTLHSFETFIGTIDVVRKESQIISITFTEEDIPQDEFYDEPLVMHELFQHSSKIKKDMEY